MPLQIWRRTDPTTFERLYFGQGPAFSEELGAWLHPDGDRLRFTDDLEGTLRWPTALERALADRERALADKDRALADKERERAQKERALEEKERERTLREAAERRIRELEEKLDGR